MNLFTKSEQILLAKFDIDYLNSPTEELIENFTVKNLITAQEENKSNNNSHSIILAPFNTHESEESDFFSENIDIENNLCYFSKKVKQENIKYELNNNEDFDNGIIITQSQQEKNEMTITKSVNTLRFCENSPNNRTENSFVIEERENNDVEGNSSGNCKKEEMSEQDEKDSNKRKTEYLQEQTKEGTSSLLNDNYNSIVVNEMVINEIEKVIGYDRIYLINAIRNREVNYATATYYLMNKDNIQVLD